MPHDQEGCCFPAGGLIQWRMEWARTIEAFFGQENKRRGVCRPVKEDDNECSHRDLGLAGGRLGSSQ